MGLTIHYRLTSRTRSSARAKALVEQIQQLALDLPFDYVDDKVRYLGPDVCQTPLDDLRDDKDNFSTVLDATMYSTCPWGTKRLMSYSCQPLEVISFWTVPGAGSEWAGFGLARYPTELEVTYRPKDDDKFTKTIKKGGMTSWEFDLTKWQRWLQSNGYNCWEPPEDEKFQDQRKIKTKLGGCWHYSSFCKTQYASNPECGGVANFVKSHLSVIHLLDRIAELPTIKVEINDEGKYGRSYFTDDWTVPKPVYSWHDGKYDVKALVQEVGQWNEMIAAKFGALNDVLNVSSSPTRLESPITGFPDFEHLEFKGQTNHEYLQPFLRAMNQLAEQERAKHRNGDPA